eukprot:15451607-Alexandrium_andersonii.AAC.1
MAELGTGHKSSRDKLHEDHGVGVGCGKAGVFSTATPDNAVFDGPAKLDPVEALLQPSLSSPQLSRSAASASGD